MGLILASRVVNSTPPASTIFSTWALMVSAFPSTRISVLRSILLCRAASGHRIGEPARVLANGLPLLFFRSFASCATRSRSRDSAFRRSRSSISFAYFGPLPALREWCRRTRSSCQTLARRTWCPGPSRSADRCRTSACLFAVVPYGWVELFGFAEGLGFNPPARTSRGTGLPAAWAARHPHGASSRHADAQLSGGRSPPPCGRPFGYRRRPRSAL